MQADFYKADLSYADFSGANVENARFAKADCSEAIFSNANLTNANLMACTFYDTNFQNAILREANVSSSSFKGTILNGADLSGLKGLDEAVIKTINIGTSERPIILEGLKAKEWLKMKSQSLSN
ncbi:pentapeptide repeat-containing protein [Bacillus sonorensis]|nr:pentapeptide repeat-containing protein [Bacillus sonorensis]